MAKIRLTKEFGFEMAHALLNYDGPCRNIHGHSYKLSVTVRGEPVTDVNDPKLGMVIDFKYLKDIIKDNIIRKYDHATVININTSKETIDGLKRSYDNILCVEYQPTCENLMLEFVDIIRRKLTPNVELVALQLNETSSSYAQWFAGDND